MEAIRKDAADWIRRAREQDHHASAMAGFTFEVNESAMGGDDTADGG
jgi:hypothetical protein